MFRVDTPTAVGTLADPDAAGTPGYFSKGDPGGGTPATIPGRDWCNMIQEELMAVVLAASLTPSKTNRAQLLAAINALIVAALPTVNENRVFVSAAAFEGTVADGDAVRWDAGNSRFAKAVADGTANHNAVGLADVTASEVTIYGEHTAGIAGRTPGAPQYLSDATPGALVETAPDGDRIRLGVAKTATAMFVDIDQLGAPPLLQGRRTAWIDASAFTAVLTAGGDTGGQSETTAGRPDVVGVDFDFAADTAFQFHWKLPPSVDPASIAFKFSVVEAETGATGDTVRLGVQGGAFAPGDSLDAAFGAAEEVSVALGTFENYYESAETGALTLAGSPAAGEFAVFRVYRDTDHADDDLDVPLRMLGAEVSYNLIAGTD